MEGTTLLVVLWFGAGEKNLETNKPLLKLETDLSGNSTFSLVLSLSFAY